MNMENRHKGLNQQLPISRFYTVSIPNTGYMNSRKPEYISFGFSYIEHSLAGHFLSLSKVLSNAERENRTLSFALKRICEILKCTEERCRILEANMTEDEYETASEEYDEELIRHIRHPRRQTSEETAEEAKILLKALGVELGSDEIAEMLNLGVMEVERALQEHKLSGK